LSYGISGFVVVAAVSAAGFAGGDTGLYSFDNVPRVRQALNTATTLAGIVLIVFAQNANAYLLNLSFGVTPARGELVIFRL
jgi:predicted cobalt transporter CbtA